MAAALDFLSAAIYLPRREDLITRDIEAAFYNLESSGFVIDPGGHMRIAMAKGIPEITGETPGARTYDGAVTMGQAASILRRVSADYWGQIMLRGRFAIGGHFENVTAVVCPFSMNSAALFSVHILFRTPGLLLKDRPLVDRGAHATEAIERLQDTFAPVVMFVDTEQPEISVAELKAGKVPWLPWAGYLSPGGLKSVGGGVLQALPDWLKWLEDAAKAPGASSSRRTRGGGLIWVLPERALGKEAYMPGGKPALEPWRVYLRRAFPQSSMASTLTRP
jgi:hypothetical protein